MYKNNLKNCLAFRFFNVINRCLFNVISRFLFNVIRRKRPVNLDCRISFGGDNREKESSLGDSYKCVAQCGRSMMEMLGVLAIVGVLSVGGIAGYSKAMERFKINKTISEYNNLMFGFFQYLDDIRKIPDDDSSPYPFSDLLVSLNLVPPSWGNSGKWLTDSLGNNFRIYPTYIEIVFNSSYKHVSNKQILFCRELFSTIAKGYQDVLSSAFIWQSGKPSYLYYGNKFCDIQSQCIRNMTLSDINEQCQKCDKIDEHTCSLVLKF